jgi:phosphinothricin acetyltransferase
MASVLEIRRARSADVSEITRIYNEAIVERIATADMQPRSVEERAEWLKQFDARYPLWVGEAKGRVVAYGALYKYSPREGYRFAAENGVYVERAARGKGYGQAMLKHVVSEAKRIGFRYVLARIFTHNEASLKLHERLGFKHLGLQKNIIEMDGRWYDVTLMDLNLH